MYVCLPTSDHAVVAVSDNIPAHIDGLVQDCSISRLSARLQYLQR